MGTITKRNFTFLLFCILVVTVLGEIYGLAQEGEILHIRHQDVMSFLETHPEYSEICKKIRINAWPCNFVCWDYLTRKIFIPNRSDIPERLHEGLSRALRTYFNEAYGQIKNTGIITKEEMLIISLIYINDRLYHLVDRIKKRCNHDENEIMFYLFDFSQSGVMKIYYRLEEFTGISCLLSFSEFETEQYCIDEWRKIFNGKDQLIIPEVSFELVFLKCDWTREDTESLQYKIEFCDNRDIGKPSHKLPEELDDIYTDSNARTYKLKFNVGDNFLKKIRTKGIWVVNKHKKTRITGTSLYSLLKLSGSNTLIEENKTKLFRFYFAKTRDFPEDHSKINTGIEDDLEGILSFIQGIIHNENRRINIHLIGFADKTGKPIGNDTDWLEKNYILASKRAENVKNWLERKLGEFMNCIERIDAEGCDKGFFDHSDRFVEVRVIVGPFHMR